MTGKQSYFWFTINYIPVLIEAGLAGSNFLLKNKQQTNLRFIVVWKLVQRPYEVEVF
jgi:hypothetical protein